MAKCRIGTAKFFTLLLLLYRTLAKDAVMLMYDGNKIGYIAKKDNTPFIICLRLNRKIYGVITDIITEQISTKYEFETWFDS